MAANDVAPDGKRWDRTSLAAAENVEWPDVYAGKLGRPIFAFEQDHAGQPQDSFENVPCDVAGVVIGLR